MIAILLFLSILVYSGNMSNLPILYDHIVSGDYVFTITILNIITLLLTLLINTMYIDDSDGDFLKSMQMVVVNVLGLASIAVYILSFFFSGPVFVGIVIMLIALLISRVVELVGDAIDMSL